MNPTPADLERLDNELAPVAVKPASLATVNRSDFTTTQVDLIRRTIARGATDDELTLFLGQCRRTGLDPFAKQIYLVKRWDSKAQKEVMAIQVGIDGYRLIADRTKSYAGNDDPVFDSESEPQKATVTVYKVVDGVRCGFTATARWSQYFPGEKQGFMWKRMPHLMLGKCAEALALRKAFPAELSGLYIAEELDQAGRGGLLPFAAPGEELTGDDEFVSGEEIEVLNKIIAEKSVTWDRPAPTILKRLLKWGGCDSLDKLPKEKFAAAVSMLTVNGEAK